MVMPRSRGLLVHFCQASGRWRWRRGRPGGRFYRLTPRCLHTLPSLWRLHVGVDACGQQVRRVQHRRLQSQPQPPQLRPQQGSRQTSALWAAIGAIPDEFHELGDGGLRASSLSASIMSVMPVISVIFGLRGCSGFTRYAHGVRHRAARHLHRADFNDRGRSWCSAPWTQSPVRR